MRSPLVALVAAGVVLSGGGGARSAEAPLTWKVDKAPFRITVLQGGRVLLREHLGRAGAGARLSYRTTGSPAYGTLTSLIGSVTTAAGTVYRVATSEPDRTATVTLRRTTRGLRIAVDFGAGSTTVRTGFESFDSPTGEHFLGMGEQRDSVDLAGTVVPVKVWAECGTSKEEPFYASSRGYGVRFETTAVGRLSFGPVVDTHGCELGTSPCAITAGLAVVQACFKAPSFVYDVYPGRPEQIVRTVAAETGRPPLPDPSQFALMKWRDAVGSENELLADATRFAAARIPLGWLILDNPWEQGGCVGTLTFDRNRYPDPSALVQRVHARGLRLMLWVSPMVRTGCGAGLYPPDRVIGPGRDQALDLTDLAVAAAFEQRLVGALGSGVDGLKVDRGDEVDLELRRLAGGSGTLLHNTYPLLLARSIDSAVRAARGSPVPTLFRAGSTGAQRLETGSWSGDLSGTWGGLQRAVRMAQTAGLVGYSTWGSDVGGYRSNSLTTDVFVRWTQLGAISPVFEVGGTGPNARPWLFGRRAMDALRSAATLHYELFPYEYQLSRVAAATGLPILRPPALSYPDDPGAWSAEGAILVGRDLLAAPVTSPGTTANVTLPPGKWVDLSTGVVLVGPQSFTRPTPMTELPLYLRAGAAIPYNLRSPDVWSAPWGRNDLFRPRRGGWLLATNGARASGSSAEYGTITARGTAARSVITVTGALPETEVLVLDGRIPTTVTVDGKALPRSRTLSTLRRARRGWLVKPAPRRGIVLKLAPRQGRSVVVLDY